MPPSAAFGRVAVAIGAVCALVACGGGDAHRLLATAAPGRPIVVFPNSDGRIATTAIGSKPAAVQAGVDGSVFTISTYDGAKFVADQVTVDGRGDVGVRGSVRVRGSIATVSHRAAKTQIAPFATDPFALLDRTAIVSYNYVGELSAVGRHIGFIAEDTPAELSGPHHDEYDVSNTVAVDLAATQQLQRRVVVLEREMANLEAALARRSRLRRPAR